MKKNNNPSWLQKWRERLSLPPQSIEELLYLMKSCTKQHLLDPESFQMMKGVLAMSQKQVRDIMVPRSQIIFLEQDQRMRDIIPLLKESKHSRFPVIVNQNMDEILGILLTKDLLYHLDEQDTKIQQWCHPAQVVPESQRLDDLLKDFQKNHNHMVMVVDEYGGTSGLVTLEDIVEEIVGEIEDEYYTEEDQLVEDMKNNTYRIQGHTPIEIINQQLGLSIPTKNFDTINGYLCQQFGYIPKRKERLIKNDYIVSIEQVERQRIRLIQIQKRV